MSTTNSKVLLTDLLRDVSRSFYLTMRILPDAIRSQISLAYLLARTADTIADTEIVPVQKRLESLRKFRERVLGRTNEPLYLDELAKNQGSPAERILLDRAEEALGLLSSLTPEDLQRVRDVLGVIISGQELDLIRFSHANEQRILALQTDLELDGYTYRVAGCVGEFWTKICRAHLFPKAAVDETFLLTNGVRFGKGLQLINILRDLPKDLRQGRCYLPREQLSAAGLTPNDLLSPANEPKFRPIYDAHLSKAQAHLRAGWDYTNALPRCHMRVRLACAWPILIGVKTIEKLHRSPVLDPAQRIKITRGEVWNIVLRSLLVCRLPALWKRQFPS